MNADLLAKERVGGFALPTERTRRPKSYIVASARGILMSAKRTALNPLRIRADRPPVPIEARDATETAQGASEASPYTSRSQALRCSSGLLR